MVRPSLVHRNDVSGKPRASWRRDATAMVRSRHRADDAHAVWIVLTRYVLGGRSQHRHQPSPQIDRVVSQTRTLIQRRHRRSSKASLERAEFINVPARPGWRRNSSRPLGKTHRNALLPGIKIHKAELMSDLLSLPCIATLPKHAEFSNPINEKNYSVAHNWRLAVN